MIVESVVLFGIEDFEEGSSGVAVEVGLADFVDFVEEDDGRVAVELRGGVGFAEGLDDETGSGGDVGAAVTADFGFVAYAAEGDALEGTV